MSCIFGVRVVHLHACRRMDTRCGAVVLWGVPISAWLCHLSPLARASCAYRNSALACPIVLSNNCIAQLDSAVEGLGLVVH